MPSSLPKLTIIIPTHNRPDFLKRAVESILSQDFWDFEIIIVDDGKVKSPKEVLKKIKDNRLIYIKTIGDMGAPHARNKGISVARGEYISFLDDDDEYLLGGLEKEMKIFEDENVDYIFSSPLNFFEEDNTTDFNNFNIARSKSDYYEGFISLKARILTSTLNIKKKLLLQVGGFDENILYSDDWDLAIRISKENKGLYLEDPVIKRTVLEGDHIGGDIGRKIKGREDVIKKHYKELKKRPKVLSDHYKLLGVFCRKKGEFLRSTLYFIKSWQFNKKDIKKFFRIFTVLSRFKR